MSDLPLSPSTFQTNGVTVRDAIDVSSPTRRSGLSSSSRISILRSIQAPKTPHRMWKLAGAIASVTGQSAASQLMSAVSRLEPVLGRKVCRQTIKLGAQTAFSARFGSLSRKLSCDESKFHKSRLLRATEGVVVSMILAMKQGMQPDDVAKLTSHSAESALRAVESCLGELLSVQDREEILQWWSAAFSQESIVQLVANQHKPEVNDFLQSLQASLSPTAQEALCAL